MPLDKKEIEVRIGEMEVSEAPYILKALLGSCVALILYDKVNRVGGLAHIFLPAKSMAKKGDDYPDSRFADSAVPSLLKEVLKQGAKKSNVVAYIVGGNNIFRKFNKSDKPTIAQQNIEATTKAIQKENLFMINCGVGKDTGSKVRIDLSTGDIIVTEIKKVSK